VSAPSGAAVRNLFRKLDVSSRIEVARTVERADAQTRRHAS
jgi:DNA-binding NarL/FixJ family response regulator